MDRERVFGHVTAVESHADGVTVDVLVEPANGCARCASGRGCGAGLFTGRSGEQHLLVPAPHDSNLAEGDAVALSASARSLLAASALAYGTPLAGLLAGAALAGLTNAGDLAAATLSGIGLLIGFVVGRRTAAARCWRNLSPVVEKVS